MTESKNLSQANKVFSGVFWKFAERFLAQIVSFVVSVVLARILLPKDYGAISIVMVFIAFADVLVVSGFSTSLVQKKDANLTDFSTIFYCSLIVAVILYGILFVTAPFVADFYKMPILKNAIRILSLRIIIGSYNSIQHAYVSRKMLFKRFFFSTLFGTVISGIIGVVLAIKGFEIWALVIQYLSNTFIDSVVLTLTIDWKPSFVFSFTSAKKLMNFGWKVTAANFSGTFFGQLRNLIVGKVYTPADLAFYNRGQQISGVLCDNLSSAIMSVLFPAFSNFSDDKERIKAMTRRAVRIMSYVIFPIAFGCAVLAKSFVLVVFTEKWMNAISFIQILCLSSTIGLIGTVGMQSIQALGRSDILLKLEFIKKPIYLILLILGVKISVFGVALTMLLYSIYATILNASPLKKIINYKYKEQIEDLFPAFTLSVVMSLIVYLSSYILLNEYLRLIVGIFIGISVYILLSKIFKVDSYFYIINFIKNKLLKSNGEKNE